MSCLLQILLKPLRTFGATLAALARGFSDLHFERGEGRAGSVLSRFTSKTTIVRQYAEQFGNPRRRSSGKCTQNAAWGAGGNKDCGVGGRVLLTFNIVVLCPEPKALFLFQTGLFFSFFFACIPNRGVCEGWEGG